MARRENSPNFAGGIVDVHSTKNTTTLRFFLEHFSIVQRNLFSRHTRARGGLIPAPRLKHAILHGQCRVHCGCSDGQGVASLDKIVQLRHLTGSSIHTQHLCEVGHTKAGPEASQTGGDGSLLHKTWGKIVSDLLSGSLPPATCISTGNQIRDPVDRRYACTRRNTILRGYV